MKRTQQSTSENSALSSISSVVSFSGKSTPVLPAASAIHEGLVSGKLRIFPRAGVKNRTQCWQVFGQVGVSETELLPFIACTQCLIVYADCSTSPTSGLNRHLLKCVKNDSKTSGIIQQAETLLSKHAAADCSIPVIVHQNNILRSTARSIRKLHTSSPRTRMPDDEDKSSVIKAAVELCARDMHSNEIVVGGGFEFFAQTLLKIGYKYGQNNSGGMPEAKDLLPSPATIQEHLAMRSGSLKNDIFKQELEAFALKYGAGITAEIANGNLSVTVHFINEIWQLVERVLDTVPFTEDPGSGDSIVNCVKRVLREFDIEPNYCTKLIFVTDPTIHAQKAVSFGGGTKHICISQVLNTLLSKLFHSQTTDRHIADANQLIDKCKSLVTYLKTNKLHRQLPDGVNLNREVEPTWWCSRHAMLLSVLRSLDEVEIVINRKYNECPHETWLWLAQIKDETDRLNNICDFIEPFTTCIKDMQSSSMSTIDQVIPAWKSLLDHCEVRDDDCDTILSLKNACKTEMQRIEDEESVITDLHYMATVLNPLTKGLRSLCASDRQRNDIYTSIRSKLPDDGDRFSASPASSCGASTVSDPPPPPAKRSHMSYAERYAEQYGNGRSDELQRYLDSRFDPDLTKDCLTFWSAIGDAQFPQLACLARQVLAVPASSVSSDRDLSAAERTVQKRRDRLKPTMISQLSVLHSYLKQLTAPQDC